MLANVNLFIQTNNLMSLGNILANNTVYRVLNIAATFFITIILSRLMGSQGYGLFSLIIVNVTVYNLLSGFGAEAGIVYNSAFGKFDINKLVTIIFSVILFQFIFLLIIGYSYYLLKHQFWFNLNHFWPLIFLFVSVAVIEKYNSLLYGHHFYSISNKIIFISNLICLLVFIFIFFGKKPGDFERYLNVYITTSVFQAMVSIIAFHKTINKPFKLAWPHSADWKLFFSYSLITFVTNCIQFLAYRVDYWMVDHFSGQNKLGIYSVAVKLVQLFWIIPLFFAGILFPATAGKKKQFNEHGMLALIRVMNVFNIAVAVISFFVTGWLIPVFFGKEYAESIMPFKWLLPGIVLFCNTTILAAYFAGKNLIKINLLGSFICFGIILILDLLLIPVYNIKGAALASSIGYGVTTIYFIWMFLKSSPYKLTDIFAINKNDWKQVFDFGTKFFIKK